MIEDPYKVLGVSPNATDDEIKQAYRRLAKKYHPDRNPGDASAAKKMQEVNAAYEQIKNPDAYRQQAGGGYQSYGSYDPFGGYGQQESDPYQRSAEQYIRFGRFREALNALQNSAAKDARWYYLSALANEGLGNQITALEHIRRAVSMEPGNAIYLQTLRNMESGGSAYRQHSGNYRQVNLGGGLWGLCLCYLFQLFCCRGIYCC